MKKINLLLITLILLLLISGCKKEDSSEKNQGYILDFTTEKVGEISKKAQKAFENATKDYYGLTLKNIAYLGYQNANGTNYMYLCKVSKDSEISYKIVTIYEEVEGIDLIKSIRNFDIDDYAEKEISLNNKDNKWIVNKNLKNNDLKEKDLFNKALEGLTGTSYIPLIHLGSKVVSGTNHVFLALGKTSTQDSIYSINVITLYESLDGNVELKTIAYIDLSSFNE